jgi:alpha-galactosidase
MQDWNTYGIGIDRSIDIASDVAEYGGPGRWNDLDMLIVGLKGKGHVSGSGLSFLEYQTHMSVWSIACSPLMIGCDVRVMDAESASLLTNREVLAVNQDKLGVPGRRVRQTGPLEVWKKPLVDGSVAVALINRGTIGDEISLKASDIGLLDSRKLVRDLWKQTDIADFEWESKHRVEPHQTLLLKVTPS